MSQLRHGNLFIFSRQRIWHSQRLLCNPFAGCSGETQKKHKSQPFLPLSLLFGEALALAVVPASAAFAAASFLAASAFALKICLTSSAIDLAALIWSVIVSNFLGKFRRLLVGLLVVGAGNNVCSTLVMGKENQNLSH